MSGYALSVRDLRKRYGHVDALKGVTFDVAPHTIHGLIGHNGSGKSTAVKILSGLASPDGGSIFLAGVDITRIEARKRSVATVFQDLPLAHSMTVVDNICVGEWRGIGPLRIIRWKKEQARVTTLLRTLGVHVDPRQEIRSLSVADRVMCCIARALIRARVTDETELTSVRALILDEPTSALPDEEIGRFYDLLSSLKVRFNIAIVLVTHDPNDVERLCDSVTALRGGAVAVTTSVADLQRGELLELMAGGSVGDPDLQSAGSAQRDALHTGVGDRPAGLLVRALSTDDMRTTFDLRISPGEIVGLTGLVGAGHEAAIRAIVGASTQRTGTVQIGGVSVPNGLVSFRRHGGIFIARGRLEGAGVGDGLVRENLTLGIAKIVNKRTIVTANRERRMTAGVLRRVGLEEQDLDRRLSDLSGGQQQKVILGRALLSNATVIALEEPTEAIDVGARAEIIELMRAAARVGASILVASSEYETLSTMCDRVLIFHDGRLNAELAGPDVTANAILTQMQ